jgi:VWFA-related protein
VRKTAVVLILTCAPALLWSPWAQEEPVETGKVEEERVNLVMVEVLVTDGQGSTVPDLTKDDFELTVQGRPVPIDVFDVTCPEGGVADPENVQRGERREPIAPDQPRRIALVFDYYHLGNTINRTDALRQARASVMLGSTANESLMVVALADGVRVEQRFTTDKAKVVQTLERMEHDASLFARSFGTISPRFFFDNLATVLDVLNVYDGTKALILYSPGIGTSTDWDTLFRDVVERSAAARAPIYPATMGGAVAGPPSLARLANETGGRGTWATNDMTLAYARVQRDLACRYAVGFYAEPAKRGTRSVRVRVSERGARARFPELIRSWSERDRLASRLRAAFADPERFDEPLVRTMVVPARPKSAKEWEALAILHFPLPVESGNAKVNVDATLSRGNVRLDKFQRKLELDPAAAGDSGDLPVTMLGTAELRPGSYNLTVALSRPGDSKVYTSQSRFTLPEVPEKGLIVNGPLLARATDKGVLLRGGDKVGEDDPELRSLIGEDGSVEPLIVHQIAPDDTLLAFWQVCTVDPTVWAEGPTIHRRFVKDGEVVHELDPLPLQLTGKKKKKAWCHGKGEKIPPGTLPVGRYRLQLSVEDRGERIAAGLVPFMVK